MKNSIDINPRYLIEINRDKPLSEFHGNVPDPIIQMPLEPYRYDLREVSLWQHEKQNNSGWATGQDIYYYLRDRNHFHHFLNIHDGYAIQEKGTEVFQELFSGKECCLWGSPYIWEKHNLHYIPCLREYKGKVILEMKWMGYFGPQHCALAFPF